MFPANWLIKKLSYWKHEEKKAFLLAGRTTSSGHCYMYCYSAEVKGGNPLQWVYCLPYIWQSPALGI